MEFWAAYFRELANSPWLAFACICGVFLVAIEVIEWKWRK
jgi:hypothetical protein